MYSEQIERKAKLLQKTANLLCYSRIIASPIIARHILKNPDYQSTKLTASIGALYAGDKIDGKLAKESRILFESNGQKDQNRPKLDEFSDKVITHSILGSIILRETKNKNYSYAATLSAIELISIFRDRKVSAHRKIAKEFNDHTLSNLSNIGVNLQRKEEINTGATKLSKKKQFAYVAGILTATFNTPETLPEVNTKHIASALLGSAAILSVISGQEIINDLEIQTESMKTKYIGLIEPDHKTLITV